MGFWQQMLGPRVHLWEKLLVFFLIWAAVGGLAVLWALMGGGHHPNAGHLLIARCVIAAVLLSGMIGFTAILMTHRKPPAD